MSGCAGCSAGDCATEHEEQSHKIIKCRKTVEVEVMAYLRLCKTPSSSLFPVQDIPYHGPVRLLGHAVLPENPVIIERVNRPVALLQFNPDIDEVGHLPVTARQRVGHGAL